MIYRTEHPKPQFMRDNWINLNGNWDFEIDYSTSGEARELSKRMLTFHKQLMYHSVQKVHSLASVILTS